MYDDNSESNLEKIYKAIAVGAGLITTLSGSTLLTIITRQIPELVIGALFIQIIPLAAAILIFLFTTNKLYRLLALGVFSAIFFSLIGGWWDAFYLYLLSFSIGQVTGFNLLVSTVMAVIGILIDRKKRGKND